MRLTKWTFICCTAASALVSTAAMAQDVCATAIPVTFGDNAYANLASFGNQLTQSNVAGTTTTTMYKTGWYSFTPSTTGIYNFATCGGSSDTKMAISATCPSSATTMWSVLGYNDDSCAYAGGTALWAARLTETNTNVPLVSPLTAGVTYYIGLGCFGAADIEASGILSITTPGGPPAGSDCSAPLTAVVGSNVFDSTDSVSTTAITGCGTDHNIYKSMYLTFTADADGTYIFNLCGGAGFDSRIAVMNTCSALDGVLACNDDACGLQSMTMAAMTAGQSAIVVVGGYGAAGGGPVTMQISMGGGGGSGCDVATATELLVGPNDFTTTVGSGNLDLTGICDPGTFGDDLCYNVTYYRFTPDQDGIWTATTCNTAPFDTRLAILGSCDPFSTVACNDDGAGCAGFTSVVEFNGVTGTEVVVAVGGYGTTDSGTGVITMVYGSTVIGCGDPLAGDCCIGGTAPACNDEACCTSVCTADPFCCNTQWDQVCADQAAFLCGLCGAGSCKIGAGSATEIELCGEDLNGGCNGAGAYEPIASGDVVLGSFWADGNFRDTDWYVIDILEGTNVTITISANMPCFAAFVDLACGGIMGAPTAGSCGGTTTFCLAAGQYYIVALPGVFAGFPCGFEFGNAYTLAVTSVPCDATPPANDLCANATEAFVGANPFDNTFASTDMAAPTCGFGGTAFLKDVWFTFTPATTETFALETCSGSAPFDTGIEVFDACPELGGTMIGCNDDGAGCPVYASRLDIALSAGVTYTIRVGGWGGANGATELIIGGGTAGPANDLCADASVIVAGSTAFSTVGATGTTLACTKFGNANIYNDIWYSYVASGNGNVNLSLCGASYDSKVAVFETNCAGALVACNDDSTAACTGTLQSELDFTPTCGTTYLICVGSYGIGGFGSGNMVLTQTGTCGTPCPADLTGDGIVSAADISSLLGAWGTAGGDINGDGTTSAADISALLAAWGACP